MSHEIDALWQRITNTLAKKAPSALKTLGGPASEKHIAALEKELSVALPTDLRLSWLLHNGQGEDGDEALLFGEFPFHSVAASRTERKDSYELAKSIGHHKQGDDLLAWAAMVEDEIGTIDGPVKARDYNPLWVPIGSYNGDVFRYVDLDPAPGGRIGQVIEVDPESVSWRVLSPSFSDFLARVANAWEFGEIDLEDPQTAPLFVSAQPGLPDYLFGLNSEKAEPSLTSTLPNAVASMGRGERMEVDVQVKQIIGVASSLSVFLVAKSGEFFYAQADASTAGLKQVTMRAKGLAVVVRQKQTAQSAYIIESFTLLKTKK